MHCRLCLCCKSGVEYELYFRALENGAGYKYVEIKPHDHLSSLLLYIRWFCHVDDDVYVNVPALVALLQSYDPLREKLYLGSWSLSRKNKLEVHVVQRM